MARACLPPACFRVQCFSHRCLPLSLNAWRAVICPHPMPGRARHASVTRLCLSLPPQQVERIRRVLCCPHATATSCARHTIRVLYQSPCKLSCPHHGFGCACVTSCIPLCSAWMRSAARQPRCRHRTLGVSARCAHVYACSRQGRTCRERAREGQRTPPAHSACAREAVCAMAWAMCAGLAQQLGCGARASRVSLLASLPAACRPLQQQKTELVSLASFPPVPCLLFPSPWYGSLAPAFQK